MAGDALASRWRNGEPGRNAKKFAESLVEGTMGEELSAKAARSNQRKKAKALEDNKMKKAASKEALAKFATASAKVALGAKLMGKTTRSESKVSIDDSER